MALASIIFGMEICPVNREWIHTYVFEPYLQGAALIKRAWKGVDFLSLERTPLSLKERLISLLTGLALMIPLINTIIWLAWQTFGNPEKLFDPYSLETKLPPPRPIPLPAIQPLVPLTLPNGEPVPTESFAYNETGKTSIIRTNWKVQQYPNMIVADEYCNEHSSTSRYDHDWRIQEYHYQSDEDSVDLWLIDPKNIRAQIVSDGGDPVDKLLELKEDIPWIQQPTLGFKNFIRSPETQMYFYGVLCTNPLKYVPFAPRPPQLVKAIAKKVGEETLPGYGKLVKVEVESVEGWTSYLPKGELLFDPRSGALCRFTNPGGFLAKKSGDLVLKAG